MNILAQRVSEGRSVMSRSAGVTPRNWTEGHKCGGTSIGAIGRVAFSNRSSTWRPLCHFCQKISGVFLTTKMDGTVQRNGNRRQLWVLI